MMARQIWLLSQGVAGSLLGLFLMTPLLAQQQLLTRAGVYKLVNQVQLLLKNQPPRLAKLSDVLISQDALCGLHRIPQQNYYLIRAL